jgi:diguanylate cyclase (GGDEF)-like protein/PAS domain S-box-containing protein
MDSMVKFYKGIGKYIAAIVLSVILGCIAYFGCHRMLDYVLAESFSDLAQQGVITIEKSIRGASEKLDFISRVFAGFFGCGLAGFLIALIFLRQKIKREEALFNKAVETANIIIISFLEDGTILSFNRNAEEWLGYKREQVVKTLTIYELLSLKDQQKLKKILEEAAQGNKEKTFELTIRTRSGGAGHVVFSLNIVDQGNNTVVYEMLGIDITPRVKSQIELMEKHEELSAVYEELAASEEELKDQLNELIHQKILLQEKDERHNLIVEACNIGIWDWDMTTNTYFYSDKWYEIHELKREEISGKENQVLTQMILPEDRDIPVTAYNHHIENRTPFYECQYRIKTADGKIKWIYAVGKVLWDQDGKPIKMAGAYTDISAEKENEEKVHRLAYYDTLTGLPNRSHLIEIFNHLKLKVSNMALVYIDLDNFKIINDSYGHAIGDSLLIEVSERLQKLCTPNMYISRNGGDEFAILVCDWESKEALEELVGNLLKTLEGLIRIKDNTISLSTHVGISLYPKDADNFNDLLKHADTAMFRAHEQRNKFLFFDKGMNDAMIERLDLRIRLKEALDNNEFLLYYQPQYRGSDRKIMGFEALVRWNSPVMGMVSPMKFIPVAEESMLILPLGEWILEEAIRFIKKIHQAGFEDMIMSVNISVIQLMQENFSDTVIRLIEAYDLAPELLELEITESAMMESMESVLKNIIFLKRRGIRFALDDFGTGYSSLNYLTQLPINTLKIDKSFIDNIGRIKEKAYLISSIMEIGQKLGLSIVAEGVETEDQYNYLVKRRCERIQGYLLSKPLPEADVMKMLMVDDRREITTA